MTMMTIINMTLTMIMITIMILHGMIIVIVRGMMTIIITLHLIMEEDIVLTLEEVHL